MFGFRVISIAFVDTTQRLQTHLRFQYDFISIADANLKLQTPYVLFRLFLRHGRCILNVLKAMLTVWLVS